MKCYIMMYRMVFAFRIANYMNYCLWYAREASGGEYEMIL